MLSHLHLNIVLGRPRQETYKEPCPQLSCAWLPALAAVFVVAAACKCQCPSGNVENVQWYYLPGCDLKHSVIVNMGTSGLYLFLTLITRMILNILMVTRRRMMMMIKGKISLAGSTDSLSDCVNTVWSQVCSQAETEVCSQACNNCKYGNLWLIWLPALIFGMTIIMLITAKLQSWSEKISCSGNEI